MLKCNFFIDCMCNSTFILKPWLQCWQSHFLYIPLYDDIQIYFILYHVIHVRYNFMITSMIISNYMVSLKTVEFQLRLGRWFYIFGLYIYINMYTCVTKACQYPPIYIIEYKTNSSKVFRCFSLDLKEIYID